MQQMRMQLHSHLLSTVKELCTVLYEVAEGIQARMYAQPEIKSPEFLRFYPPHTTHSQSDRS